MTTVVRLCMSITGMRRRSSLIRVAGRGARVCVVTSVNRLGASLTAILGSNRVRRGLRLIAWGTDRVVIVTCLWTTVVIRPQVWHRSSWVNNRLWVLSRVRLLLLLILFEGSSWVVPRLSRAVVTMRNLAVLLRL